MKFQCKIKFVIVLSLILFLSSCKSISPINREAQNSSLNLAMLFVEGVENPENETNMKTLYDMFSFKTKNYLSYADFTTPLIKLSQKNQLIKRKYEFSNWEKYELKDGGALVYILKKSQLSTFSKKKPFYAIYRLHLVKEHEKWAVDIENPEKFDGFDIVEKGDVDILSDSKMEDLRNRIKADSEKYQFVCDTRNQDDQQIILAKKCVDDGERLYDQEKYREALMQFQKSLSIDPKNEKAKTYIARCQKAISIGMGK